MKHKNIWLPWLLLIVGLFITLASSYSIKQNTDYIAENKFEFLGKEISEKINNRLHAHAQVLRSGAAFFSGSDVVTREEWKTYVEQAKVHKNLPGTLGFGFSLSIQKNQLEQHIQKIRSEGFPKYSVWPEGERDTYSSIVFLEPFLDRNLRAFGYDMFSEPVRREAMERARDMDIAALSGKITLVQETGEDVQAGALMYVPLYRKGAQTNTTEQRRSALIGWVYSPYRMDDLMYGILDNIMRRQGNLFHLDIYDGSQNSPQSLLFESHLSSHFDIQEKTHLTQNAQIEFNNHHWTLVIAQSRENIIREYIYAWIVLFSGVIISILLFALAKSLLNTRYAAQQIAEQISFKLKQSEESLNVIAKSTGDVLYRLRYDTMKYDYISPAITDLTGYSMAEINEIGFNNLVEQISHPGRAKLSVEDQINSRKAGKVGEWSGEYKIQIKSGEVKWISDHSYPWKDNSGNNIGSVGIMQDITKLKQVEEEALQKTDDLLLINSLNNAANRGESLQSILTVFVDEIKRLFSSSGATLYLLSEDKEYLVMQNLELQSQLKNRLEKLIGMSVPKVSIRMKGGSQYWEIIQEQKPRIINDPKTIQRLISDFTENRIVKGLIPKIYNILNYNSVIVVPLISNGEAIGLVDMSSKELFTESDLERFKAITGQLILTIERKQTEEALQKSEERYRSVVQDQTEYIMRYLPDGTRTFVNDSYCRTFNTTEEQVLGESFLYDVSKTSKQRLKKKIADLTLENPVISDEHESITTEGKKIWRQWVDRGIFDEKGVLKEIQATGSDITERKQAEESLQFRIKLESLTSAISSKFINLHSEEVNKGINGALQDIAELIDADRSYVFLFSDNMTTMSNTHEWCAEGIEPQMDKLQGIPVEAVPWWMEKLCRLENIYIPRVADLPPEASSEKEILQDQNIQSLIVVPMIYTEVLVGFVGSDSVRAEKAWSGEIVSLIKIIGEMIINALEHERAEVGLASLRKHNEMILKTAGEGIYGLDLEGKTTFVNPAAAKMIGWDPNDLIGKSQHDVLHYSRPDGTPYPREECPIYAAFTDGGVHSVDDEVFWHKNGSSFPVEYISTPIRDEQGNILGAVVTFKDISKRKLIQNQLESALIEAKQANQVKDQFISNISHEIRTPLNSIIGFSDLFQQRYGELVRDKDKDIFGFITNSSNRLMRTVESILNLSQLDAGSIKIEKRGHDLNYIVRAVIGEVKPQLNEKGLEITYIPTDQQAKVLVDDHSMHQSILNIIENAIKYTLEGNIDIKLIQKKDSYRLSIQDTGIGISEKYQKRIFDPYTQESEGFTKNYQGIGLGLALAKRYLELNDVELELESQKNVGSTFTLIFLKHEGG
ncbi:MAG: CHASE domain-containing protein [Candidatus Marinimicrobia bacterium]|nr:CHASE domain-containing protein [FCB group bacterium]MBL7028253.1 CHASE domain-containing protein [Candidatus Neomarinimicrobiota bacterium]